METKFTKGFMDRSSIKLSEKINEYSERYNLNIVSINMAVTNTDAPIIEAIVLFSKEIRSEEEKFANELTEKNFDDFKKGNN